MRTGTYNIMLKYVCCSCGCVSVWERLSTKANIPLKMYFLSISDTVSEILIIYIGKLIHTTEI